MFLCLKKNSVSSVLLCGESNLKKQICMNLPVTQKHFLSFSRKLFLSVISLFLVFAACFMAYQYQREKEYKVELLNIQLQDCNNLLYEKLYDHPQDMTPIITDYLRHNVLKDLRITVVNLEGKVLQVPAG